MLLGEAFAYLPERVTAEEVAPPTRYASMAPRPWLPGRDPRR